MRNLIILVLITTLIYPSSFANSKKNSKKVNFNRDIAYSLNAFKNMGDIVRAAVTFDAPEKKVVQWLKASNISYDKTLPKVKFVEGKIKFEGFDHLFDLNQLHKGAMNVGGQKFTFSEDIFDPNNLKRLVRFLEKIDKKNAHNYSILINKAYAETDREKTNRWLIWGIGSALTLYAIFLRYAFKAIFYNKPVLAFAMVVIFANFIALGGDLFIKQSNKNGEWLTCKDGKIYVVDYSKKPKPTLVPFKRNFSLLSPLFDFSHKSISAFEVFMAELDCEEQGNLLNQIAKRLGHYAGSMEKYVKSFLPSSPAESVQ